MSKVNIIHIVGASGAGTSTLGQALEQECGYKWLDTDIFFWLPSDPPFVQSRPREERAALLADEMQKHQTCVISGSLCDWGDVFIPQFDLVVFVDTPTDIRIERLHKREYERFGERISEGGDMHEEHLRFIEWAGIYDKAGIDQRSRALHEEWFKLLKCPIMRLNGTEPIGMLVAQVITARYVMEFGYENILSRYGINEPLSITQIYRSAWKIGDDYILKHNETQGEFDKSIWLSRFLLSEGIPVIEYIDTVEGEPYVYAENKYWCLMKRIKGIVFDPFIGNPKHNGIQLGRAVAGLHRAMKNIEDKVNVRDVDFHDEFVSWILPEIEKGGISFRDGVLASLHSFLERDYPSLPRQLIHRDMHTSNLLYDNGVFSYLDFDLCQRNVRLFDLVYLGCSQLVENYKDESRLTVWREIFSGIIQGYTGASPLSEEEIKAIPALFLFDEVLFTAFYLKYGDPETAKSCVEMTNWMVDNIHSIFINGYAKGVEIIR